MPVYSVRAPDGSILKVQAASPEVAMQGAREHFASRQAAGQSPSFRPRNLQELITGKSADDTPGYRKALAQAQGNIRTTPGTGPLAAFSGGLLGGFNDEIEGAGDAVNTWIGNHTGKPAPYSPGEAYRAGRDAVRARQAQYADKHPIVNGALTVAGALATPGVGAGARFIARAPSVASALGRTAVVGGVQGALTGFGSADGTLADRARGAAVGGALGAGAGVALRAGGGALVSAGRRAAANPTAARLLSQQGVRLTPGQMAGGLVQRAEDAMTSTPILGDAIRAAKTRGLESFDRAAVNKVLAPIEQELPKGIDVGRDAYNHASQQVSNAYQKALAPITVAADKPYTDAIDAVVRDPKLPAAVKANLNDILNNTTRDRMVTPADGQTWKAVDSELGAASRSARTASGQDPVQKYLADALDKVRAAHYDLLDRTDSAAAAGVKQADTATANLVRIRQASQVPTTARNAGLFTPAELNRAVQGKDASAGNRDFAGGHALMQDLTDPAMKVLPSTVPDSGTPFRTLMYTLGGAGGLGAAAGHPTEAALGTLGSLTAGAGVYHPLVQDALNAVYRASTPGQARVALGQFGELASKFPEAAPLYDALVHQLPTADDQRSQQPAQP